MWRVFQPAWHIVFVEPNHCAVKFSAVKLCALMQAIIFFQFNALKLFNAINAVAGLGLATPL